MRFDRWQDPSNTVEWHSPYTELFWLPVLGPTSTWLGRRAAGRTFEVDAETLARYIGVGGTGRHSPLMRSLHRLVAFHVAHVWEDPAGPVWFVYDRLPFLDPHHLRRLPPDLQVAHERYADRLVEA